MTVTRYSHRPAAPDERETRDRGRQENVRDVMPGIDMAVWGLSEVPARYTFPTRALPPAGVPSTAGHPDFIDHQLGTDEVQARYAAGSATAFQPRAYVPDRATTTSDHHPVPARYAFAADGGGGTNQPPTASFTHTCAGLGCAFTDTGGDADGAIAGHHGDFGDDRTSSATHPSVTYPAAGPYPVSLTVTDDGGATHTTTTTTTTNVTVTTGGGGSPAAAVVNEVPANEPGDATLSSPRPQALGEEPLLRYGASRVLQDSWICWYSSGQRTARDSGR